MFTDSTPLTELEAHGLALTGNAPEDCRVCTLIVAPALEQDANMSWGEFLAIIGSYPEECVGAWVWIRINFSDVITGAAKILLTIEAAQDPGEAGRLYIANPGLSENERDILIEATANAPNIRAAMGL